MKHHELSGLAKRIASGLLLGALLVSELAGFSVPKVQAAPAAAKSYTAVFTEGEGLDRTVSVKGVSGTALTKLADNLSEYLGAEASAIEAVQFTVSDGKDHTKIETELSGVQASDKMHLYKQSGSSFTEWEFSVAKDGAVWSRFDLPGVYVFTDTAAASSGKDGVTLLPDAADGVTVLDGKDDVTVLKDGVDAASADAAFLDAGISAQSDDAAVHADHVSVTDLSIPAYAAVYADGYMVFQRGDDFSEMVAAHGEIVGGPWTGFETEEYATGSDVPWNDYLHSVFIEDGYGNISNLKAYHDKYCNNSVRTVVFLDSIKPKYTSYWFGCVTNTRYEEGDSFKISGYAGYESGISITDVKMGYNLDLSECIKMNSMFRYCFKLNDIEGISSWNMPNVMSMNSAFSKCASLSSIVDCSNWNLLSCSDFSFLFYRCPNVVVKNFKPLTNSAIYLGSGFSLNLYSTQYRYVNNEDSYYYEGCDKRVNSMIGDSNVDLSDCNILLHPGDDFEFDMLYSLNLSNVRCNNLSIYRTAFIDLSNIQINNDKIYSDTIILDPFAIKEIVLGGSLFGKNALKRITDCMKVRTKNWKCKETGEILSTDTILSRFDSDSNVYTYMPVDDFVIAYYSDGTAVVGKDADKLNNHGSLVEYSCVFDYELNSVFGIWCSCEIEPFFIRAKTLIVMDDVVTSFGYIFRYYNDSSRQFNPDIVIIESQNPVNINYLDGVPRYKLNDDGTFGEVISNKACGNLSPGVYVKKISVTFISELQHNKYVFDDVYYGKNINVLPEPEAIPTGYYFLGWFTEREGGMQLKPGDPIQQTTYYAHWQDYTYDLVLKPNGADGEDLTQSGLEYHKAHRLPGDIYRYEGKVFKGWNTRKDGTGTHYEPKDYIAGMTEVDGGKVTLYAEWEDEPEYVTITFTSNIEGAPVPDPIRVEKGQTLYFSQLPKPEYDGYSLFAYRAFYTDSGNVFVENSGFNGYLSGNFFREDVTLEYKWYKNPTVTFHASPEAEDTVITVPYSTKLSAGQVPSYPQTADRTVRMMGWYKDEALTSAGVNVTSVITEDTHYYAKWGYKPVWNANGGQITSDLSVYGYQTGSQYVIESLPEAYFTGRTLDGWFLEDGTEVHAGDTVDLTVFPKITARWTRKDIVTITFDKNGAVNYSGNMAPVVYKGDPVEFPVIIQGPRRSVSGIYWYPPFLGWADADGNFHQSGEVFLEDITLTAQFGTLNCTLTFDAQGGSTPMGLNVSSGKMIVASGSTLSNLPGSKKDKYILDGWYSEPEGVGTKLTTETVVTESGTWYANWKPFLVSEAGDTSYYTFGAGWSNASNTSVTNAEDRLDWHVSSTSSVSSSLHLWFELSKDAVADGKVIPVGAVKIRIPKYIWKDWSGNNTGSNNVSSEFVKYPATKSDMWFSYLEDGDDYVIVNSKELSGSAGLSATINYSVYPADVPGGAWDRLYAEQDFPYADVEVPVEFTVDSDGDGVLEVDQNKTLHAEMHHILGESASMGYADISYTAPSGTDMYGKEDADQYFYVKWYVSHTKSSSLQSVSAVYKADGYSDGQDISVSESGKPMPNVNIAYSVWTKHPISLLLNAPAEGVKLSNYGTVYTTFRSGYQLNIPVSASTTVYMPKYPMGQYTKRQSRNINSNSSYTLNGGQEDILDDEKEVTMPYRIEWNGQTPVDPVWNEKKGVYEVPEYTMTFEDGLPGDVLYNSGSVSAKYVWEPSCGNVMLEDEDYYFGNIKLTLDGYDAEKANGVWKEIQATNSVPVRFYVRRRNMDYYDFVFSKNVYVNTSGVVIPSDVWSQKDIVGFKLEVDSALYREYVRLDADLMLKPTNHVKQLLQADVDQKASSIIKNGARCKAYLTALGDTEEGRFFYAYDNTGGNNAANKNCYELNVSRTTQYTVKYAGSQGKTIFDVERGTQDTPMAIMAYNYNNSTRKKKMTTGTFYDLLPAGTSVDPVTVFGRLGNLNSSSGLSANLYDSYKENRDNLYVDESLYNVSFIHNYQDSGRTMMVIDYTAPEDGRIFTGIYFWYLLHNTYENVMEHGTNVENDVAFVNRTPDRVPPYSKSGALSTITEKQYFQSLEDAYSADISYARANTNYIPVDAVSWGFDKTVQTVSEYLHADQCLLNDQYRYKLTYSQSAYADSSSLVFFDVLENGAEVKGEDGSLQQLNSAWHGTLEHVDVSSAANKLTKDSTTVHCAPVIYYSTKPRDQFTGADYTLENTVTWSSVKPADLSTVTAIAVDCRKNTDGTDFVMHGQESLEIIVHMRAPKDSAYAGRAAYNTGIVRASHDGAEPTDQYSDAEVTLKEEDPELHKTSDPASGTEDRPADVFQDDVLTYTLSVANHGELTAKDIVLSDVVPEGLSVRTEEVKIHFGDASKVVAANVSPRLRFTRDGQALSFTVRTLLPGETACIEVPCTVLVTEGVLENTAHITSINGVEKEITSETTWHEAQPATMAVFKKGYGDTGVVGARMQLIAEDGSIAHEWVTDGRTESFIVPAGTYTVHEVEAPAGYFPAEDITVVLDRQGYRYVNGEKVGAVEMQDDYTKVSVLKQDEEGNPLPGAVLAVYEVPEGYDGGGGGSEEDLVTVVWSSKVAEYVAEVKRSLIQDDVLNDYLNDHCEYAYGMSGNVGYYRFTGWKPLKWAADNYVIIEATYEEMTPEVPPDAPDPSPVVPDPDPDSADADPSEDIQAAPYTASRMTIQNGPVLTGIAADAAAGKLGEPVKRWTSATEAEPLYGLLEQGREYVLVEESVPSSDYRLAEPVRFTVNADGSEQVITMTDPYDGYTFDVYKYGGSKGNPLAGAKLSIYPKGMGSAEENIGDVDMPDYKEGTDVSGRMSMEGGTEQEDSQFPITWTSGEGPQKIRLKAGTYILHEEEAPEGYRKHADIQFTVLQNGKVMYDQEGFIEDSIYMIDEPNTVEVDVTKQVEGNMGSKSKAFDFTLRLWKDGASGESLTLSCIRDGKAEEVAAVYDADSGCYVYDFKLRHGEQASFGLPYGWAYRIGEEYALRSGYQVAIDGPSRADIGYKAADDIADASVEALAAEPSSYVFTNTRNVGVATGFSAMTGVTVLMGILSICAVAVLAFLRYRKKQKPAA